jgi:phospholipase/lecithinase/hemolysin
VQTRRTAILSTFVAVLLALVSTDRAYAYSAVIAYGDSLSDNGNLFGAIGYPPAPYYNGRFSNGPVSIEQLATRLGDPLIDYAVGGATSGVGNFIDGGTQTTLGTDFLPFVQLPGMLAELSAFPPPPALVSSALFTVWGGANDFEAGGTAAIAVADIDAIVAALKADGAKYILVPGLPDLGLTPEFYGDPAATLFSEEFNAGLEATLPAGATYFDTFTLLDNIVADPSAFGFTDVTDSCFNGVTVCADPSKYLFWDDIHPTTATDAILAEKFDAAVTPEPSSILLLGSGLIGIALLLRRRRMA